MVGVGSKFRSKGKVRLSVHWYTGKFVYRVVGKHSQDWIPFQSNGDPDKDSDSRFSITDVAIPESG